jgi:hypothetical protein
MLEAIIRRHIVKRIRWPNFLPGPKICPKQIHVLHNNRGDNQETHSEEDQVAQLLTRAENLSKTNTRITQIRRQIVKRIKLPSFLPGPKICPKQIHV